MKLYIDMLRRRVRMALKGAGFMAVVLAAAVLTSCGGRGWQLAEGSVWGTTYRIVYEGPGHLADSVQAQLNAVDGSLSAFNSQSLVSKINRGSTAEVDSLFARVFTISREVSLGSGGRFDPTVGPLVDLWGFGRDRKARSRAEADSAFCVAQEQIDSALRLVGIVDCHLENVGGAVRLVKKHPQTSFDFSAVAKGYACDLVAAMLRRNGVKNYMVEIGGEIALAGKNPRRQPWRIQIDAPRASVDSVVHDSLQTIEIDGAVGVATSGNYRNFHESKRYGRFGHTIDPVTGRPVATDVVSATVIAPDAATADAWATACMASDAATAIDRIRHADGLECLLVVAAGDSTLQTVATKSFPKAVR